MGRFLCIQEWNILRGLHYLLLMSITKGLSHHRGNEFSILSVIEEEQESVEVTDTLQSMLELPASENVCDNLENVGSGSLENVSSDTPENDIQVLIPDDHMCTVIICSLNTVDKYQIVMNWKIGVSNPNTNRILNTSRRHCSIFNVCGSLKWLAPIKSGYGLSPSKLRMRGTRYYYGTGTSIHKYTAQAQIYTPLIVSRSLPIMAHVPSYILIPVLLEYK